MKINLTLRTKMILMLAPVLLIMGAMGAIIVGQIEDINELVQENYNDGLLNIELVGKTIDAARQSQASLLFLQNTNSAFEQQRQLDIMNQQQAQVTTLLEDYARRSQIDLNSDAGDAKLLNEVNVAWQAYIDSSQEVAQLRISGEVEEANVILKGDTQQRLDHAIALLLLVQDIVDNEALARFSASQSVNLAAEQLVIALTISAIIVGIGLAFWFGRTTIVRLVDLMAAADMIAEGNLDQRVQVAGGDEIGRLGEVFNNMTAQLQQTLGRLDRRIRQIGTSAEVSRRLSTILDEQELVTAVVTSLQDAFNYYHVHIYLLDQAGNTLVMAGGTGEAGAQLLAQNHAIATGRGLVGTAAKTNTVRLVPDVSQNQDWVANPLLPDTKAEIAVPITLGNQVLGVLDVQSNQIDGLGEPDQELLQAITSQVAIALQNARQYASVQRSQAAIEERETLLRTIIDSTPDWIFVKDLDHRYRLVNQGYADSFHMAPDDFIGKNDLEIGFPEEIVKGNPEKGIRGFWADDREIMARGELKIIDEEPAVVDGEDRFLNTIKAPLKDDSGTVTGVVGYVHDITELKHQERRTLIAYRQQSVINDILQNAAEIPLEELLLNTLDQILELPWMPVRPEGGVFLSEPGAPTLKLVAQRNLAPQLHTLCALVPYGHCLCGRAAATGKIQFASCVNDAHEISFEGMAPHGHYNVPLVTDANQVVGVMVFYLEHGHQRDEDEVAFLESVGRVMANIIQRKRTEEELKEAQERMTAILESIKVPLVISRVTDGKVAYVNEPLAEIIRIPREELMGQITPDFYHDPVDRETYLTTLREQGQVNNFDLRLKRGDGDLFWALISGRLFHFEGEPAIITSVIDITERREAQATVARRAKELETVAEVGTVAATILEPDALLQQVVDLTKARFGLYHAHVYLLDDNQANLILANGAGEVGHKMVAEGRKIALNQEQSLVARAARTGKGVVINDVQAEAGFLPHSLLPETRSEMAVPLVAGDEVLGVLDVQADVINLFTGEEINIFTTLAAQIAVALQNARRYNQAQRALDELTRLQRVMAREGWQAFLTAQKRPFVGYAFDGKGAKQIADKNEAEKLVAPDNGKSEAAPAETETAVSIPIAVRGEKIGQLGLRSSDGSAIPERKRALLTAVANQVSEALERARLSEQTQQALTQTNEQARRLAKLNELSEEISRADTRKEIVSILMQRVPEILEASRLSLHLIDEEDETMLRVAGVVGDVAETSENSLVPLAESPMAQALAKRQLVSGSFDTGEQVLQAHFAPLYASGQPLGTFNMAIPADRELTEGERQILLQIASLLGTALESRKLFEQTRSRAEREELVNTISQKIRQTTTMQSALETAVRELGQALHAKYTQVKVDPGEKKSKPAVVAGTNKRNGRSGHDSQDE